METAIVALTLLLPSAIVSDIKSDQVVVFYPGYAYLDAEGKTWTLLIRGSVFEPHTDSVKRTLMISTIRSALKVEANSSEARMLDLRLRHFLVDHKHGKQIVIRIGTRVYNLGKSGADGYFAFGVQLPAAAVPPARDQDADARWLSFEAVLPEGDPRRMFGRVQLVGPRGMSVISDIDDTIKITQVKDRKAMLANTFLREFKPVPGMPRLYQDLATWGAAFHYVSGSPWQLYEPLADFCRREGFPQGTFHLKSLRLSDPSSLLKLTSQEEHKLAAIEPVLTAFPNRRFVLIGDSGEQDPEIYGKLARKYGDQIAAILIRNVTDETLDGERMRKALAGIARERLRLFRQTEEVELPVRRFELRQ